MKNKLCKFEKNKGLQRALPFWSQIKIVVSVLDSQTECEIYNNYQNENKHIYHQYILSVS